MSKYCCYSKGTKNRNMPPQSYDEEEGEYDEEDGEDDVYDNDCSKINIRTSEIPYLWYPSHQSVKQIDFVRKLECEFACLQRAYLSLTTQFARMQFRLRQIILALPCERDALLLELEKLAFKGGDEVPCSDELPRIQRDLRCMGDVRRKQADIIENLRSHLTALAEASEIEGIEYETGSDFNSDDCPNNLPGPSNESQQHSSLSGTPQSKAVTPPSKAVTPPSKAATTPSKAATPPSKATPSPKEKPSPALKAQPSQTSQSKSAAPSLKEKPIKIQDPSTKSQSPTGKKK